MKVKLMMGVYLAGLLAACGGGRESAAPAAVPVAVAPVNFFLNGPALQDEVERVRAAHGLPGLSVVTVENGRMESVAAGVRAVGVATALAPSDRIQVGSITKGATAFLLARLVEQRRLRWDSTLSELFPAWSASMAPSLRVVTVEQILQHRAGFKRDITEADFGDLAPLATGDGANDRATAAQYLLRQTPQLVPNTQYGYSNIGYMVAGLIAETIAGSDYASLMQKEVFVPMQMSALIGVPETSGTGGLSGHQLIGNAWRPVSNTEQENQIQSLLAPAGGGMISMSEYGKYLHEQLKGLRGQSTLLGQESFRRMHTPVDGYGLGWAVTEVPGLGLVSVHTGTWDTYYTIAILVPSSNRAIAVACNCYGEATMEQIDRFARRLVLGRE